jgi:hypothetical protein
MNLVLLVWVLAVAVALLLGYEVGKWLFGTNQKLQAKKRAAQTVATKLRKKGLKLLPQLLDDFVVGDISDFLARLQDMAKLVEAGNDAIDKELDETFEAVLDAKLTTAEGAALISAKLAAHSLPAAPPPPVAPPAPVAPSAPVPAAPPVQKL